MSIKCPKCHSDNPDDTIYCGKCATPLKPSEDIPAHTETLEAPREELTTGSTFAGRYQIIEELGKGGMGRVYKVLDKEVKAKIALKLIKSEIASDKKTIERFRNELKTARDISHKNICRMYDLNKEEGSYYITMEYVSGEDLKSFIRRSKQLAIGTAISIANQVCEGLTEAHRLGVVHRDLKPSNIMIDKDGNARIMDFGIARSLESKGITGAGVMIGTPEYMSPEQVEGKEIDQRTDIYSLGVILYEMVTGRVPFEGDTALTIAVKQKTEVPKDPRDFNTQIPKDLSDVILRCLEKDKDKRYQSAGEVRSELTNIEEGIPTTERVILERKPLTSREITVTFGLRKLFIPALVFIGIVIVGVIIWQLIPQKEAVLVPEGKPSLAVMYFKNNPGDPGLDHWRTMISDLFIADLTQSKYIEVVSGERLFKILSDLNQLEAKSYSSDVMKQVAAQGGVNHILVGNYAKAEETIRINITLQEARTEKILASEGVEGKGKESIFSMVDELTKRIKTNFKLTPDEIAGDIDEEVGQITTPSLEALKYYSEGRKFHNNGENRKSIQLMEKAVSIDPKFAMAYRSMAMSYNNLFLRAESMKFIRSALEFTDRLSDRERYLIEGDFYGRSQKTYNKSIEAYTRLLELYPEDEIGNHNLGLNYYFIEEWDKAIEKYEVCRKNKFEFIPSYNQLASSYMAKGMYDKAKEVFEDYIDTFSDNVEIHQYLAINFINQGEIDLAIGEMDKAFYLNPTHFRNFMLKGDIYLYKENFIKAKEEYQKLLEEKELFALVLGYISLNNLYLLQGRFEDAKNLNMQAIEQSQKVGDNFWKSIWYLTLAYIHLKSRNPEEAIKECDYAWNSAVEAEFLPIQKDTLHYRGLAFVEIGLIVEAQKAADELKEMIDGGVNKKIIRIHHHLMGTIEYEKGNFTDAIEYYNQAISLLPYQSGTFRPRDHAEFIDSLALAYYKAGDLKRAQEEYEKITQLTAGRLNYGDIYAKIFYMLGKIHEEQGNKAKAIEHYEKFLDLWKDADPGIAEVDDARERLAGLKGN
jgi:pentatricopeptide repeat protein